MRKNPEKLSFTARELLEIEYALKYALMQYAETPDFTEDRRKRLVELANRINTLEPTWRKIMAITVKTTWGHLNPNADARISGGRANLER